MVNAVFLDRDGTLNRAFVRDGKPYAPRSIGEFELLPGVAEACRMMKKAGYLLVVATNQPDVGRGTLAAQTVEQMHAYLRRSLPLDRIEVCYLPGRGVRSDCRKPRPGMLLRAAREMAIDLSASFMVGDRWRDIDCGRAAGCRTIFIDQGYQEELRKDPDFRVSSLLEAAEDRMLRNLNVKIFADGADLKEMLDLYANPLIRGLTTNPTLMARAGIRNYELFARHVLEVVRDKPISFEVLSDDFEEMQRQAFKIASWQQNVYVKIPVTNTRGESSAGLIRRLSGAGVKVNVTAILTSRQLGHVVEALEPSVASILSVFAGRVADTGIDPEPMMRECLALARGARGAELLWASVREVLNIFQADRCGCDIVTATRAILAKALDLGGMDLEALSRDTVRMFAHDAECAGFAL